MSSFGLDPTIFTFKRADELCFIWENNELVRTQEEECDCSAKTTAKYAPCTIEMSNTSCFGRSQYTDAPIFTEAEEHYFPVKRTIELESSDDVVIDSAMEDPSSAFSSDVAPDFSMEISYSDEDLDEEVHLSPDSFVDIKLAPSKSPIMDALVFCALNNWGICLVKEEGDDIQFEVNNFKMYYKISSKICAKQNPTEDQASRIKALKRWFPDFPSRRDRSHQPKPFLISVSKGSRKDNKPKKLREIIDRNRHTLAKSLSSNQAKSIRSS